MFGHAGTQYCSIVVCVYTDAHLEASTRSVEFDASAWPENQIHMCAAHARQNYEFSIQATLNTIETTFAVSFDRWLCPLSTSSRREVRALTAGSQEAFWTGPELHCYHRGKGSLLLQLEHCHFKLTHVWNYRLCRCVSSGLPCHHAIMSLYLRSSLCTSILYRLVAQICLLLLLLQSFFNYLHFTGRVSRMLVFMSMPFLDALSKHWSDTFWGL